MASLVLTDSSQLTVDSFEKLPDQIMYPYAEPYDLQKHVYKVEAMRELAAKPHTVEALSYHVTANSPVGEWAPHADQSVISNGGLSYPVNQDATKVTELDADLNQQSTRIKMNGIQKQTINFDSRVKNLDGPNQVLPADKLHTVSPHGRVKLRTEEEGMAALRPISVPGVLDRTAEQYPEAVALAHKGMGGTWQQITYRDYRTAVRTCSKAFLKLGLKRYHSVCILGFNSPEWFISDLAAIHAWVSKLYVCILGNSSFLIWLPSMRGFAAGIYTTNSPEACYYCAENSQANIIVVEDHTQLDKILQIRERLPELKAIIQYRGTPPDTPGIYSWDDVMKMGQEESDEELEQVLKTIAINECCTLVYTSGTVGNPKAVMLSHDNLTWSAHVVGEYLHVVPGSGEKLVSFLPLSHVAAQCVDIHLALFEAATVYFADKDALKGTLVNTLQEVRPTRFLGVPRVWEKIYEKMTRIGSQNGSIKRSIATWAKGHGLQHNLDKMNGERGLILGSELAVVRRLLMWPDVLLLVVYSLDGEIGEDTENIKKGIQALEVLKCEHPRKRRPLITIFDVPSDITVEELAETGYKQNLEGRITQKEFLEGFEPRFKTGVKKRRVTNHVVEVSARVWNLLFGGCVFLHFNGVSVKDYLVIMRCKRCRVKFCPKKESVCGHCGKVGHELKECEVNTQ
uniref:long-chain-fatty-acid--CoA ligase n=1 Tax=Timema cristinae TaxID=61476 RepID=A0A7R9H1D1_TIMCR|nr:unnamed protein product [Timema cristinae]